MEGSEEQVLRRSTKSTSPEPQVRRSPCDEFPKQESVGLGEGFKTPIRLERHWTQSTKYMQLCILNRWRETSSRWSGSATVSFG